MKSFKQYIIEKFIDMQKMPGYKNPFSIWKNPDPKEVKEAMDEGGYPDIRGWVDHNGSGDLYIFNSDLEHHYAMKNSRMAANFYPVPIWLYPKTQQVEISAFSVKEYYGFSSPDVYWIDYDEMDDYMKNEVKESERSYKQWKKNLEKNRNIRAAFGGKSVREVGIQ